MMVGGGRTPPFAACLVQTGYAPGMDSRLHRLRAAFPVAGRTPCLSPVCLRALRQLTKVGRGLRERSRVPQLVRPTETRITS
eukprot:scaffold62003_cov38-Phaeocystis_antarctica.AAC.2